MVCWGHTFQVSGLRWPDIWYGSSGSGTGADPEPVPDAEHPNLGPDGRDPGPENKSYPLDQSRFPVSLGEMYRFRERTAQRAVPTWAFYNNRIFLYPDVAGGD